MKKNGFLKFILFCGFIAAAAYAVVKILAKLKEKCANEDDAYDCDDEEEVGCTGCCDECELCDDDEEADDEVAAVEGAE